MTIREITFERSKSLGAAGEVRIGARADVAPEEDPTQAFRALRAWVDERVGHKALPSEAPTRPPRFQEDGRLAANTPTPQRAPVAPQRPPQAQGGLQPLQSPQAAPAASQAPRNGAPQREAFSSAPRSPKALFAWCREQEDRTGQAIVKYVNGWTTGTAQWLGDDGRGIKMTDFTDDQVQAAFAEVCRVLAQNGHPVAYAPTPAQTQAIFAKVGLMLSPEGRVVPYVPSADEVRQRLIDAIETVAQMETGEEKPSEGQWIAALSSLDAARESAGLPILADINTCDDVALMESYLQAARDAVTVGA